MNRWTLGMPLKAFVLSAILGVSQFSLAAKTLQRNQTATSIDVSIKSASGDNKGLLSTSLTAPSTEVPVKTQSRDNQSADTEMMGGVSDGGGNAVGDTLFDFYESEGALELTVEQLIALEPQVTSMLQFLNQQVPRIGNVTGPGLGEILAKSLNGKKIYLDRKPISSQGCLNQSIVSTINQRIAACQSDSELRINSEWIKATSIKNRAGLILHEMILAWYRADLKDRFDKKDLEQKVRELVRAAFYVPTMDIAKVITATTGVKAFGGKDYALLVGLPSKLKGAYEAFCRDPKQGPATVLPEYFDKGFLFSQLHSEIRAMQVISNWLSQDGYKMPEDVKNAYSSAKYYCRILDLDRAPVNKPGPTDINTQCKPAIDEAIDLYASISTEVSDMSAQEKQWVQIRVAKDILRRSKICGQGVVGRAEALAKVANYAKWRLQTEHNLGISFVRSMALQNEIFRTPHGDDE